MTDTITILAPIKLAVGKTEADLLAASDRFQREFADNQAGLLRRELLRRGEGDYLDMIQFRSRADADAVVEKEKASPACDAFFAIMDMGAAGGSGGVEVCPSLATYSSLQAGVEIARFRLRAGVSEADMLVAYATMEARFLQHQPGYCGHRLSKLDGGIYVDLTFAADKQAAERICASWRGQANCEEFLALIDADSIEFGAVI